MTDQPADATRKKALMGELESIRYLLGDEQMADIPVLNDVVKTNRGSQSDQLEQLKAAFSAEFNQPATDRELSDNEAEQTSETFPDLGDQALQAEAAPVTEEFLPPLREEEQDDLFPFLDDADDDVESANEQAIDKRPPEPFSIEPLIQNIIDEALPAFEAQLRQRLSECSPEIIRQLAQRYNRQ